MSPDGLHPKTSLTHPRIQDIQTEAEGSSYLLNITQALEQMTPKYQHIIINKLREAQTAYDLGCGYKKAGTNILTQPKKGWDFDELIPDILCPRLQTIRYVDIIAEPDVEEPNTFHKQFIADFLSQHPNHEADVVVIAHAPNHSLDKPENNGAELLFKAMSEGGILIGFLHSNLNRVPNLNKYFEKITYTKRTIAMNFANTEIYIRRKESLE